MKSTGKREVKKKKAAKIYCLDVILLLMDINMKNDSEREIGVGSLNVSKPLGAGRVNGVGLRVTRSLAYA